jgi:hypothetical protein
LFGPEVGKIDHADPSVRAIVDVEEPSVVLAVGFTECGVMRITPAKRVRPAADERLVQRLFRPVGAVTILQATGAFRACCPSIS